MVLAASSHKLLAPPCLIEPHERRRYATLWALSRDDEAAHRTRRISSKKPGRSRSLTALARSSEVTATTRAFSGSRTESTTSANSLQVENRNLNRYIQSCIRQMIGA